MTWEMRDKEFEAVLNTPGPKRYLYTVKKVADFEEVWSLWSDNAWVLAADDAQHELVPIWPHPRFAAACATGVWSQSEPRMIELSTWLEKWIPGIGRDSRLIAVFPTASDKGVVVSSDRLKSDLEDEVSQYE